MYKVLDIREIITIYGGSTSNGVYGGSGSFNVKSKQYIIVIAENVQEHKRKRFEFCEAYKSEFLGETCYYGYTGEFNILIPGDYFEIEETSSWPKVKLLKRIEE